MECYALSLHPLKPIPSVFNWFDDLNRSWALLIIARDVSTVVIIRCCMPYRISAVLPWNSTRLKTRCFPTTRSSVARQATPASTCKVRTCTLVLGPHGTPQLRREAQSVQGPQTAEKFSVENAQFLSKSSCSMIAYSGSRERKILRGSSKLTKHVTGVDHSRNVITGVM